MNAYFKIAATTLCGMLLGLSAPQAGAQSPTKELHVELGTAEGDFRVFPGDLKLKVGEQYRLMLVNWSQEYRHILMSPEFEKAVTTTGIRSYPERVAMRGASFAGGINVPPGERVEMYFVPNKEGRYKLICQDRDHTAGGMDVTIDVGR